MTAREHTFQAFAAKFVEAALDEPHLFLAFDRAKPPGRSRGAQLAAMARQKARGMKAGTPDTLLITAGASIWCEWKAPGEEVRDGDQQDVMGQTLLGLGHHWSWCSSIIVYHDWLESIGIRMRRNSAIIAADYQGKAEAAAARPKAARSYKPQVVKPTRRRLNRIAALRGEVMF